MTPDIERMAKEAGMVPIYQRLMRRDGDFIRYESIPAPLPEWVAKFAALIAEECAKAVEHLERSAASRYNQQPSGTRYQDFGQPPTPAQVIRSKFPMPKGEA